MHPAAAANKVICFDRHAHGGGSLLCALDVFQWRSRRGTRSKGICALDAVDREGRTALFYAALDGDVDRVASLVGEGSNVDAKDGRLETPLHFAARGHHLEVVEMLLLAGAEVDPQDEHGNTPLWRAVFEAEGRLEVVRCLLRAGADRALKNTHGVSPEDLAKTMANYDMAAAFE